MNYRHSYHAGNIADVFKHYVLTLVLGALHAKPSPFCAIDSHAGAGIYALDPGGEHEQGISSLWPERDTWPALGRYFEVVARFNPDRRLRHYPGSPLIIREFLRAQDRAVLLELHPQEHALLKANLHGQTGMAVHHTDAWNGLRAFVPPKENRGVVLIDPPYEKQDELKLVVAALKHAMRHWRNGIFLVWYPIKARRPVDAFHRAVAAMQVSAHAVEFITLPLDMERRLNGSGMLIINPPWQLLGTLRDSLPPLAVRLAGAAGSPQVRFVSLGPG